MALPNDGKFKKKSEISIQPYILAGDIRTGFNITKGCATTPNICEQMIKECNDSGGSIKHCKTCQEDQCNGFKGDFDDGILKKKI